MLGIRCPSQFFLTFPAGCSGEITSAGTEFMSTDHPNNYSNNEDCTQIVRFAEGQRIRLEFLHFNLEEGPGVCR